MDDAGFSIELSATARRDLDNQLVWLLENRSGSYVDRFLEAFGTLMKGISSQPFRWQKVLLFGQPVRRAVLMKHWIVLYDVNENISSVLVQAIRGAAEDWTNIPVVD